MTRMLYKSISGAVSETPTGKAGSVLVSLPGEIPGWVKLDTKVIPYTSSKSGALPLSLIHISEPTRPY